MPVKPSEKEEEYFARMKFDKRKRIEEEKYKKLKEEEKEKLKKLHYMSCPKCGMEIIEILPAQNPADFFCFFAASG